MPELLTGTVTFLFSDIEGSTQLLRATGERWPALLERHREIMREAIAANGGEEVGTEGDSFFVAFPTAPGAVAAAVDAQRALQVEPWPPDERIRVRIGMHTGEASLSAGTYVGLHVHRASRIASVGHGGQVLISDPTRALVGDALPDGVGLRDLGEHRLKDLEHPERLWQLVIPGLATEFPPLASLDATPNNLPTRLTTFLGREAQIAEVGTLLADHRLLTLTGPGGTGKTRLSLEVAGLAMRHFPDGVFFVELAPIRDPDLVPSTIAQALALPEAGGRPALDRLADHIGPKRVLLVLDNFEQVTGAAPSVNQLLSACANLHVLASSRAALGVSGEQEYPVPPLGVPDPQNLPPLAQLSQYEAVALFIERARAVKPGFEVTNENAPAVAEICVRLDGLPLAIELAAARIRILTPQAMLGRLGDRLGLLSGGGRDLPARQQTLRGAIAWSHDMLDEADRTLFACLGAFIGGTNLELLERVCEDQVGGNLLDALGSLVEKSLVRQSEGVGGEPRFSMLETIREFAVERATADGRWETLGERHARAFADLARESGAGTLGSASGGSLDRLEEEHDNLRAAYEWLLEHDLGAAMGMASALWRFWQRRGHLSEGLERVEAALARAESRDDPAARADALMAAAGLAYWLGDTDRSRANYLAEIEARQALGDRSGLAAAHYGMSFVFSVLDLANPNMATSAEEHIEIALGIYRELGDEAGIARCEWALANVLWGTHRIEEARRHALHSLELFESIGDPFMIGWASYTAGLGALSDAKRSDDPADTAEADRHFRRALVTFREAGDITGYTLVLDGMAVLALYQGDRARSARLTGAVGRLEKVSGTGLNPWNRNVLGFDPEELRTDPALADEIAAGAALTPEEAVAYALGEPVAAGTG